MPRTVLITQCLQQDFVGLVDAHAPLPNQLHVGRPEAVRLLGRDPEHGPVSQLMDWARDQDTDGIDILHIRDWHDPADPAQAAHLAQFGPHCLKQTPGAALILGLDDAVEARENERFVDSLTLNDFDGTRLETVMDELKAKSPDGLLRVGVVGVWTEAKVTFLLYELRTRCGIDELATCSALTASASRSQHFNALSQLRNILGVHIFDSVGDFSSWMLPDGKEHAVSAPAPGFGPSIDVKGDAASTLEAADQALLTHLFRDSATVTLSELGGGYSGARVFSARSTDALGQEHAPSVVKVGPRKLIGTERAAFEQVEEVLGNDAPNVLGFSEFGARAGLKYAYAAMGRGEVQTFQSRYMGGAPLPEIEEILEVAFGEILGRFYRAAQYERLGLLEHYGFAPKWADSVARKVAALVDDPEAPRFTFPGGYTVDNIVGFYRDFLANHTVDRDEFHFVSYVHGDLNGANILIDGRQNVWIIDFFHTARSHVLKDLVKLENDLLYIFTPIEDEATLQEALLITQALRAVEDLRAPLPEHLDGLTSPALVRAWATVRCLRARVAALCQSDRSPLQMHIASLRYAAHTLSFDECSMFQRRWALASACGLAEDVQRAYSRNDALWVDWLPNAMFPGTGRVGLTLCPGRADRGRDLGADLDALAAAEVRHVVCLIGENELDWAGVPDLRERAEARGMDFTHLPIPDQCVPTLAEAEALSQQIRDWLAADENVLIHCMGGLGRSGLVAASLLVDTGMSATEAIGEVRDVRDPRAVETRAQEAFVERYAQRLL